MTRIRVDLRDVPGTLAGAIQCIEDSGANIVHVHHHRNFTELPLQIVEVEFILQTRGKAHLQEIMDALQAKQFKVRSLY
jgi:threonine dehydratase